MDIIVLQGLPNRGKTETIGRVYDLIINAGGISSNKQRIGGDPRDFEDIVKYKNKEIAFFSMGDNSTALSNAIWKYDIAKCDLLICALSTGTPKVRANYAINSHNSTRLNKTVARNVTDQSNVNMTDAQHIFALI